MRTLRAPVWLLFANVALALALTLASGCTLRGEGLLATWTRRLAMAQEDGPELLLFRRGDQTLAFVGVEHDPGPTSATHRLIKATAAGITPKIVIIEGVPTAWGYDPARILAIAGEVPDANGLLPSGETVPAVQGAQLPGAKVIGGEPTDTEVRRITSALGVHEEDLLGFYVLRAVPIWFSQRQTTDLTSPRASLLIDQDLDDSRKALGIDAAVLPDAAAWRRWRATRKAGSDPQQIDIKEAGPLADGPWPTSRIGAAISQALDRHLYRLTRMQLAEHRSVMVVYGASHATIQLPAMHAVLGEACYRIKAVEAAVRACRVLSDDGVKEERR